MQVSLSDTVQAGNAKEAASASFVPTRGRGLLESDSVPPEPRTGVPIVGVSNVRQIRQAVRDGAPHILVQSHIDLRLEHTDATFTLGPLTNDTKSITVCVVFLFALRKLSDLSRRFCCPGNFVNYKKDARIFV